MTKLNRPGLLFLVIFLWKFGLFLLATLPVPANDAFFYDGAVVNKVLHGGYFNPSLALALPISGTEVFCAYPPLHQATLLVWMSLFGTSARAAICLHLVWFGIYELVLLAILKPLKLQTWHYHLSAAFLFLITFHDRPDTLAHVLGMLAVLGWTKTRIWREEMEPTPRAESALRLWLWTGLMVLASALCWCTSLQIGAIYSLILGLGMMGARLFRKETLPWGSLAILVVIPIALIGLVRFGFPHLWTGFLEHAHQTPSFTGWRRPLLGEFLKVGRNAPGVILAAVLLPWAFKNNWGRGPWWLGRTPPVFAASLLASLAVVGACLTVLTANTIAIVNFLQPLVVATFLGACFQPAARNSVLVSRWNGLTTAALACGVVLGSLRFLGLTTWGVACAWDLGYDRSIQRVAAELDSQPPGATVVLSSGYLYEAARHPKVRWLHSDWLVPIRRGEMDGDLQGLLAQKPAELILTSFDYYRRYQAVLEKLEKDPACARVQVEITAKISPPDAHKSLQQIVQHISWAPVLVKLEWR